MNPSTRRIYSSEDTLMMPITFQRKRQGREGRFASPAAMGSAEK
jgi:hypothetical protein